jgi:hypothetical protein
LRVARPVRDLQDLLHRADAVGMLRGRHDPVPLPPRLARVFVRVCRTVSALMSSTRSSAPRGSASSLKGQRARPAGGRLQARALRRASCAPSRCGPRCCALGRRDHAAANPASTSRWRRRWTVDTPTAKAAPMFGSDPPGPSTSACSTLLARNTLAAATRGVPRRSCNVDRSSSVNRITSCASLLLFCSFLTKHGTEQLSSKPAAPVNINLLDH